MMGKYKYIFNNGNICLKKGIKVIWVFVNIREKLIRIEEKDFARSVLMYF